MAEHDEDTWPAGWDGHQQAQLRRLARLTLAEKLAWLEEADGLVRQLRRGRLQAAAGTGPPSDRREMRVKARREDV